MNDIAEVKREVYGMIPPEAIEKEMGMVRICQAPPNQEKESLMALFFYCYPRKKSC